MYKMYTVSKINTLDGFESLEPVWNSLIDENKHPNVFLTFEWLHTWWQIFGADHNLYIIVTREGNDVVGIAPLMQSEYSFLGRRKKSIRFLGSPESDYGDFIGKDCAVVTGKTMEYLLQSRSDWTDIELSQISERSPTIDHLKNFLGSQSIAYRVKEIETCFSYVFEGDDAARAEFIPKKKKNLRNCINSLEKTGTLDLQEIRDADEIERHLCDFFHLHVTRWGKTSTPSRFLDSRHRDFFLALVRKMAPKGRISLLVLRHKDLPVSYLFNFDFHNTIFVYTPTHNLHYDKKSPGLILSIMARQYYVRSGYAEFDWTRGGEIYKVNQANRQYTNYHVKIYDRKLDYFVTGWYDRLKTTLPVRKLIRNRKFMDGKAKLGYLYRSIGATEMSRKIIKKAYRFLIDYRTMLIFKHDKQPDLSTKPALDVEFRKLDESCIAEIAGFLGAEENSDKHKIIIEKFAKQSDCFACYYNGHIVSVGWGMFHEDIDPGTGFSITGGKGQVLFSDGLTSPIFRNLGIAQFRIAREIDHYHKQGLECLSAISQTNIPSLRVAEKLGFVRIGKAHQLKILGMKVISFKPVMSPGR